MKGLFYVDFISFIISTNEIIARHTAKDLLISYTQLFFHDIFLFSFLNYFYEIIFLEIEGKTTSNGKFFTHLFIYIFSQWESKYKFEFIHFSIAVIKNLMRNYI